MEELAKAITLLARASIRSNVYLDDDAAKTAAGCARGCYQRALLTGREGWSGATIRGAARNYGGRYKASRDALLSRIEDAGVEIAEVRVRDCGGQVSVARNGRIVMVFETAGDRSEA